MKGKESVLCFSHKYLFVIVFIVVLMCFSTTVYAKEVEAKSYDEVKKYVYETMLKRESSISIRYTGSDINSIHQKFQGDTIYKDVVNMDDKSTSDDGVYMMKEAYGGSSFMCRVENDKTIFTMNFKWNETLEQSQYINNQVKSIINETGVLSMNNAYDRAIKLRDYLLANMTYKSGNDTTVYDGLSTKIGNCHVYSMLYYKLLQEAKVDCYYVTGNVSSGWHGWNIIKLGNKWYNIDVTFEENGTIGTYSMKGKNSFAATHSYDSEYLTSEFLGKYSISDTDFCKLSYLGNDLMSTTTTTLRNQAVSKDRDASVVLNNTETTTKKEDKVETIKKEEVEIEEKEEEDKTEKKVGNKTDYSPQTGDNTGLLGIGIIALVAVILLSFSSGKMYRNRR